MRAGDRFTNHATGQSGVIELIFLAGDERGYQEIGEDDLPDLVVLVVRLDDGSGWVAESITADSLVPAGTALH